MNTTRRRVRDIIAEEPAKELAEGLGFSRQYIYTLKDGSAPITLSVVARMRAWRGDAVDIDQEIAELLEESG